MLLVVVLNLGFTDLIFISTYCTVSDNNISQGSVVTHLRFGGIFSDHFIANMQEGMTLK